MWCGGVHCGAVEGRGVEWNVVWGSVILCGGKECTVVWSSSVVHKASLILSLLLA